MTDESTAGPSEAMESEVTRVAAGHLSAVTMAERLDHLAHDGEARDTRLAKIEERLDALQQDMLDRMTQANKWFTEHISSNPEEPEPEADPEPDEPDYGDHIVATVDVKDGRVTDLRRIGRAPRDGTYALVGPPFGEDGPIPDPEPPEPERPEPYAYAVEREQDGITSRMYLSPAEDTARAVAEMDGLSVRREGRMPYTYHIRPLYIDPPTPDDRPVVRAWMNPSWKEQWERNGWDPYVSLSPDSPSPGVWVPVEIREVEDHD